MADGTNIAGFDVDEVRAVLSEKQDALAAAPLEVTVGSTTINTDPVTLGASIDEDEMVVEAMEVGRRGFFLTRPFTWLGRLLGSVELPILFQYDAEVTAGAAQTVVAAELDQPREPELVLGGDEQLVVEPGSSGITINPRELVGRLPAVIEAGEPYRIDLQAEVADPSVDQAALESVAAEINELTAEPVRIQVLDEFADVQPTMLKNWTVVDTTDGSNPQWTIDQRQVLEDLKPLFPSLGSEDQKARFTVVGGDPVIVPASETVICCEEDSLATIRPLLAEPPTRADNT